MIKMVALLSMLLEHTGKVFFPCTTFYSIIGRISFPLFAWGIARGFEKTRNYKLYVLRLLLLGIVSQFPYYLLHKNHYLNVCFTLLLGLLVLKVIKSSILELIKLPLVVILLITAHMAELEYGAYGIALILIFYKFDNCFVHLALISVANVAGITIMPPIVKTRKIFCKLFSFPC